MRLLLALLLATFLTEAQAQQFTPADLTNKTHVSSGLCILEDGKVLPCNTYGKEGEPHLYFALFDTIGFKTEMVEIKRYDLKTQQQVTVWVRRSI